MTPTNLAVPGRRLIVLLRFPRRDVAEGEDEAGQPRQAAERALEALAGHCGWHRLQREVLQVA